MFSVVCGGTLASAQTDIRKIDFKNFAYELSCTAPEERIYLKKGDHVFHVAKSSETEREVYFTVEIK